VTPTFVWVLAVLASWRMWRLIAVDDLPGWRDRIDRASAHAEARFGPRWADGIVCPWCSGFWVTVAVFTTVDLFTTVPLPVLQAVAGSAAVGWLGERDG